MMWSGVQCLWHGWLRRGLVAVLLCLSCLAHSMGVSAQSPSSFSVLEGHHPTDEANFISQYRLTRHLTAITEYALAPEGKLFVLGINQSGEVELGLRLSSAEQDNAYSAITILPVADAAALLKASLTVLLVKGDRGVPCVLVKYTSGNVGNRIEETQTFMDLRCPSAESSGYVLAYHQKIAEKNIAWQRHAADESGYLYLAVDHSRRGRGNIEPARKTTSMLSVADVNQDGFADIVIHTQSFRSKLSEDADLPDFVLDADRVTALIYEPALRRFEEASVGIDRSGLSEALKNGIPLFHEKGMGKDTHEEGGVLPQPSP